MSASSAKVAEDVEDAADSAVADPIAFDSLADVAPLLGPLPVRRPVPSQHFAVVPGPISSAASVS